MVYSCDVCHASCDNHNPPTFRDVTIWQGNHGACFHPICSGECMEKAYKLCFPCDKCEFCKLGLIAGCGIIGCGDMLDKILRETMEEYKKLEKYLSPFTGEWV